MEETQITELLSTLQNKILELNQLQEQHNTQSAALSREIIEILDRAPPFDVLPKPTRAKLLYFKGRALANPDTYDRFAEENLTRSVKLDPTNGDAWN